MRRLAQLTLMAGLGGAAVLLSGCSALPEPVGASVPYRSGPAVAVDNAALAERVGRLTAEADRCGLTIDLERNKRMLREFQKRVGRNEGEIEATMTGFEQAFAAGVARGCPGGDRAALGEALILIEDGRFNQLMAR